jgi:hypothetical protein
MMLLRGGRVLGNRLTKHAQLRWHRYWRRLKGAREEEEKIQIEKVNKDKRKLKKRRERMRKNRRENYEKNKRKKSKRKFGS